MLNLQTNFVGNAAAMMILRPVAECETFKQKLVSVVETDRAYFIPRLEIDDFIQSYSPDPIDGSTIVVDEVKIPITSWNIYTQFNPLDFKEHWFAKDMQRDMLGATLPPNAGQYLLKHIMDRHNLHLGMNYWRGDVRFNTQNPNTISPSDVGLPTTEQRTKQANLKYFDGLIKKFQNDPDTIKVSGYALTSANVITALQAVYNKVQQAQIGQYGDSGLKFLFSVRTLQIVEEAYNIVTTFKNFSFGQGIENKFLQYQMCPLPEFPEDTILALFANDDPQRTNLFLAVNSTNDDANLKMDFINPKSDEMFIKGIVKAGAGYGWADQAVLFTNLTYNI